MNMGYRSPWLTTLGEVKMTRSSLRGLCHCSWVPIWSGNTRVEDGIDVLHKLMLGGFWDSRYVSFSDPSEYPHFPDFYLFNFSGEGRKELIPRVYLVGSWFGGSWVYCVDNVTEWRDTHLNTFETFGVQHRLRVWVRRHSTKVCLLRVYFSIEGCRTTPSPLGGTVLLVFCDCPYLIVSWTPVSIKCSSKDEPEVEYFCSKCSRLISTL